MRVHEYLLQLVTSVRILIYVNGDSEIIRTLILRLSERSFLHIPIAVQFHVRFLNYFLLQAYSSRQILISYPSPDRRCATVPVP